MSKTFRAFVISRDPANEQQLRGWQTLMDDDLMEGDVTVRVTHTTMNYKDALAVTGRSPVVRRFPMIPGIDLAGQVIASDNPDFQVGDAVMLNGWGVGEVHMGGYAERARLRADWLMHLPRGLSAAECMAIGTAGYTAALCVTSLLHAGLKPADGPILVTGASGGVGSVAVALLAAHGFEVWASTGKRDEAEYLKEIGATQIIDREEFAQKVRPLAKERFAGAIDAVGGMTLASILSQIKYGGTVAACGLAQGVELPTTVMPFILRGVALVGIDSVMAPNAKRQAAWSMLAEKLDRNLLDRIRQPASLENVERLSEELLSGRLKGRLVFAV